MGGGSSEVTPHRRRSVADALAERLPGAVVSSEVGCRIDRGLPAIDLRLVTPPSGGASGFAVEYFDNAELAGEPVATGSAHSARIMWIGPPQPGLVTGACSVRIGGRFTPDVAGAWRLGLETAGRSVLRLDGDVVLDNTDPARGQGFYGAGSAPVEVTLDLAAGRTYDLAVEVWPRSTSSPIMGARIGASPSETGDEFERAVRAAAEADVAVVVVGSNGEWESEGHDRPDLSLPGRQRELVDAVIEANRRTVVLVNAGSPVEMPWAERAGAVLMAWYPGEEGADALADILVGLAEPAGRLPVTIPARVEDGPAGLGLEGVRYPGVEGRVEYGEGVLVGYRFYETARLAPRFEFGFGLSYGDIAYEDVQASGDRVTVRLLNKGPRRGTEVVQVYVRAPEAEVRRPDRELAGFAKVSLEAGGRGHGGDRPRRRRLPLLGRRHTRVAVGSGALRDPGRRVIARHPGHHRGQLARRAARVTGGSGGSGTAGAGAGTAGAGAGTSEASRPWTLTWDRLLVEPRRPQAIRERPDAHWFAVAAVCVGAFMGQLDASIVTVALPTLQHTFDASVGAVTWVGLVLSARPRGHRDRRRPVRRHVGTQASLRLWLRGLHAGLGSVRAGTGPGRALWLPRRSRPSAPPCCRPTAWPSSCSSFPAGPWAAPSDCRAPRRRWGWRWARRSADCCSLPGAGDFSSS